MHSTIDCEIVFDVLTRGPVSLNDEPEVRDHLCHCSECRQLAEAFRPAIGLIHESLDDQGLPCVQGFPDASELVFDVNQLDVKQLADEGAGWLAKNASNRATDYSADSPQPPATTSPATPSWMPLLAAMLAGVALIGWSSPNTPDGPNTPVNGSEHVQLPASHPPLVAAEGGTKLCCVECHHPGAEHSQPSVHLLAQSCMSCHVHREL